METDQDQGRSSISTRQEEPESEDADMEISSTSTVESKLFQLLRPHCVLIMKSPTSAHLEQLSSILQEIPPDLELPPQLVEYMVFPLSTHLKFDSNLRQDVLIDVYNCLGLIVSRWSIASFVIFMELFTRLNVGFGSKEEPTRLNPKLPEEALSPLLSCLAHLITKSLPHHLSILYTPKFVPSVGHAIFMLLQIVTGDTAVEIRLTALNALHELVKSSSGNELACRQMFKFLPGLTTGLRSACALTGKRHKKLVVKSLSALQTVMKVCTSGETADTLQLADVNLSPVLRQISDSYMVSEDECVKNGLTEFSVDLVNSLTGKMPICEEILWNNIFTLASEPTQVGEKCRARISEVPLSIKSEICSPEIILTLTRAASNQIKGNDEIGCVLILKRISSTIAIASLSASHLKDFLSILVNVISCSLARKSKSPCLDIELKSGDSLSEVCASICSNLATGNDLTGILDQLSELMKDVNSAEWISSCKSAALIFITNCVLRSCGGVAGRLIESEEVISSASTFVRCLNTAVETGSVQVVKLEPIPGPSTRLLPFPSLDAPAFELTRAIYEMYLLEGFQVLLSIDPPANHPFILPEIVYVLLEHAGREDYDFVSDAAVRAIQSISPTESIDYILAENLDLILSELSLRMKSDRGGAGTNERLPMAVVFLAKYFDFSQQSFVRFVGHVFFQSQRDVGEDGKRQLVYAQLFYALIESLWRHQGGMMKEEDDSQMELQSEDQPHRQGRNRKSLLERLLEYQKSVGMSMAEAEMETEPNPIPEIEQEQEMQDQNVGQAENEDVPLPPDADLALRICNRVLHYLPISNRPTKFLAVDTLIKGVQLLKPYENSLLPLSHQIWDYLVPRFEEHDPVVVRQAFELLRALCKASETFLRKRTVAEVFPKLSAILQKLAMDGETVKDKNRVYYTTTQAYKLQICVLEGLAELCQSIEIHERDLHRVADGCLLYLKPKQHRNLKAAAMKLLQDLAQSQHGASIFMKLVESGTCEVPERPPNDSGFRQLL